LWKNLYGQINKKKKGDRIREKPIKMIKLVKIKAINGMSSTSTKRKLTSFSGQDGCKNNSTID
jgi:hypothetical protein